MSAEVRAGPAFGVEATTKLNAFVDRRPEMTNETAAHHFAGLDRSHRRVAIVVGPGHDRHPVALDGRLARASEAAAVV